MKLIAIIIVALSLSGCAATQKLFGGQQELAVACAAMTTRSDECFTRLYANQDAAYRTLIKRVQAGRVSPPMAKATLAKLDSAFDAITKADTLIGDGDIVSANGQIAIAVAILTELETL